MKSYTIIMRPIVVNDHGGLVFFSATCGLKGAVETSTSGASVHSLLWDAGYSAAPFCMAMNLKSIRETLNRDFKKDPVSRGKATLVFFGLMVIVPIFIFSIGPDTADPNTPTPNDSGLSFICSKQEGSHNASYYFVETVGAVDQMIKLPNQITDVTIRMSRISSKGGWDNNSLCDSSSIDLPENEWRTLTIGSDCGVGASISACDANVVSDSVGVSAVHLFPLVNGYYSGAAGKIEKGTLVKITGVPIK